MAPESSAFCHGSDAHEVSTAATELHAAMHRELEPHLAVRQGAFLGGRCGVVDGLGRELTRKTHQGKSWVGGKYDEFWCRRCGNPGKKSDG
jgi:hypothetical protein